MQTHLLIRDPDLLTIEMVKELFIESHNDEYKGWQQIAAQEDFNRWGLPIAEMDRFCYTVLQMKLNGFSNKHEFLEETYR